MERKCILIATKTYPSISKKYRETVCTAGVLLDENNQPLEWIRIYPVRYRKLDFDRRYPRWSIISALIEKNDKDSRPESYRIDDSSIEIIRTISPVDKWSERKYFLLPLLYRSIRDLKENNRSLGLIKPKNIIEYYSEKTEREWKPKQQATLDQLDLFELPVELEKIPYRFGYRFIDNDNEEHRYSISDWEISQLYRNCRDKSTHKELQKKEAEALEMVRKKLEDNFLSKKDLYFIVGNLKDRRNIFMIIGLFYPPIIEAEQLTLF